MGHLLFSGTLVSIELSVVHDNCVCVEGERSSDKGCAFFKDLKKLAHIVESRVFGNVAAQTLAAFFSFAGYILPKCYIKN
jgi:hypothetical protein